MKRFDAPTPHIGVVVGVHLFLLPNPQRWKPVLARGGSAKSLNHNDFLLAFLR